MIGTWYLPLLCYKLYRTMYHKLVFHHRNAFIALLQYSSGRVSVNGCSWHMDLAIVAPETNTKVSTGYCGKHHKPGAQHCAHCHLQLSRMAQVRGRQASYAQPPQMLRVSKLERTCCWLTSNPCRCRRCDGGSDACLLLTYTRWAWTRCMPETGHVSADGSSANAPAGVAVP